MAISFTRAAADNWGSLRDSLLLMMIVASRTRSTTWSGADSEYSIHSCAKRGRRNSARMVFPSRETMRSMGGELYHEECDALHHRGLFVCFSVSPWERVGRALRG